MFKMRRVAVLAVVALGLVALAVPAGASANKRTNEDIKRLGNNVSELRKKTDEMNNTIAQLASVAGSSLTQLRDGLVTLSDTTANFKYAVVQVAPSGTGIGGLGSAAPTHFYSTPPILPTGAQSTVTFGVPAGLGAISLYTAVRSLKPDTGAVQCRYTISGGTDSFWMTLEQGTSTGIFIKMPQSRLTPQNGNTAFPYSLVPTEDNVLDLGDSKYGQKARLGGASPLREQASVGGTAQTSGGSGNNGTTVSLSCLRSS